MEKTNKKQSVMASAIFMALGTFGSRILGFVRDMVLASYFSVTLRDAFVVAFRLPNLFRRLLGEGALSVSFIPIYIDQLTVKDGEDPSVSRERAANLAAGIHTVLLAVTIVISVLAIVLMPELTRSLVGSGFDLVDGKLEVTIALARGMFFYLFLVTSYAFYMAILNAHQQFFWPAMAPAIFNLVFVALAMTPDSWWWFSGMQLAVAVLVGGVFQVGMVSISLLRQGLFPRVRFKKLSPECKNVFKNMVPGLLGMGVLQFMALINVKFASLTGEGSHSYIYFADRILELPNSLIAISLGAALLPRLSEAWAAGRKENMLEVGQKHIRSFLFVAMPAAAGMYTLALPIVQVLFERGNFTAEDSNVTAMIVQVYSLLLLVSGVSRVLLPNFYAIKNTWFPAVASVGSLIVHASIAYLFIQAWGLKGLVYSTVVASGVNFIFLIWGYYSFIGKFFLGKLMASMCYTIPLSGLLYLAAPWVYSAFINFELVLSLGLDIARVFSLFAVVLLSLVVYFGISLLVGHPEVGFLKSRLIKK